MLPPGQTAPARQRGCRCGSGRSPDYVQDAAPGMTGYPRATVRRQRVRTARQPGLPPAGCLRSAPPSAAATVVVGACASPVRPFTRLRLRKWLLELRILRLCRPQQVRHAYRLVSLGRQEGRAERDIADVAAADVESSQLVLVQSACRRAGGEYAPPDLGPLKHVRERELNDEADASQKSRIQRPLEVGRQDGQPAVGLHALQQIADLDVRVAIVAIFHFAALAEEGIGLVKQQNHATLFSGVEDSAQVLLGLTDVLADGGRQIDSIQVEP